MLRRCARSRVLDRRVICCGQKPSASLPFRGPRRRAAPRRRRGLRRDEHPAGPPPLHRSWSTARSEASFLRRWDILNISIWLSLKTWCVLADRYGSSDLYKPSRPAWSGVIYQTFLKHSLPYSKSFRCKWRHCVWPNSEGLRQEVFATLRK